MKFLGRLRTKRLRFRKRYTPLFSQFFSPAHSKKIDQIVFVSKPNKGWTVYERNSLVDVLFGRR